MQFRSPGWADPLEEETATHASILPGKSHGQRSLVGHSPWGRKESDTTEAAAHGHTPSSYHSSVGKGDLKSSGEM